MFYTLWRTAYGWFVSDSGVARPLAVLPVAWVAAVLVAAAVVLGNGTAARADVCVPYYYYYPECPWNDCPGFCKTNFSCSLAECVGIETCHCWDYVK